MNKKPILSEREKKNVLSAKKKQKVVLRNLLVQPFDRYWPELTAADAQHFVKAFSSHYKLSSSYKSSSSTSIISHQKVDNNTPNEFTTKLKLGLQSSIRCVSSGQRLALFISSKIRPKYIVDQIITMTLTKNNDSKIFCVPNMGEELLEVLGFSCQCLAILESQSEIWSWILSKSKEFPLPERLNCANLSKTERMDVDNSESLEKAKHENNKVDVTTLYLRKENGNERAFIPRGSVFRDLGQNTVDDFISLGETSLKINNIRPTHQMISKIQRLEKPVAKHLLPPGRFSMKKKNQKGHKQTLHSNKVNYVSLKVNRVQSNPEKNRNKNKKKNKK